MNPANRGMNLTQQVADTLGNAIINGKYGSVGPPYIKVVDPKESGINIRSNIS